MADCDSVSAVPGAVGAAPLALGVGVWAGPPGARPSWGESAEHAQSSRAAHTTDLHTGYLLDATIKGMAYRPAGAPVKGYQGKGIRRASRSPKTSTSRAARVRKGPKGIRA